MKRKKIGFLGLFGQQNLGNDCTLQAIIYNARKYIPDLEVFCICSGPDDVQIKFDIPTFSISDPFIKKFDSRVHSKHSNIVLKILRKIFIRLPSELLHWAMAFRTLMGTHMLIIPGTGFLTDAYTGPFGWSYGIFKWSLVAKLCRCKLLFVGVGAGPIYRPLSKWFTKRALSMADFRSYRDISTKEYLQSIGFSTNNDIVKPDLAFNLPEVLISHIEKIEKRRPVVGIGLMSYPGKLSVENPNSATYTAYLEKLVIFVEWLLERGYDVRLLIGDLIYDEPAKNDFMELFRKSKSCHLVGRIIDEPILSVEHLLSQLAVIDFVVATRFHNVLLSIVLNKPVISISFHHKCVSLMNEIGLSDYCQDIHQLDVDRLVEQFCSVEKNADNLKLLMKQKTQEYRLALDDQYKLIFNGI